MNPPNKYGQSSGLSKPSAEKLAELLARARASRGIASTPTDSTDSTATPIETVKPNSTATNTLTSNNTLTGVGRDGSTISYNEEQLKFMQVASKGGSAVLIGAAGTGKTTCMRGTITSLIQSGLIPTLESDGHKYLQSGTPGILAVSFTRRAVANLRRAMPDDMKGNCITIHAALEYEPVYYEVLDPVTNEYRNTMRFEPTRTPMRPLPPSIKCCMIDEASMVSLELFQQLKDALPSNCQFIFLGDIQQLPPVFGSAILGYKMLELPTIELIQVYRQALESPIIRLAHRILSGKSIPANEYSEWKFPKLTIHPWKKKIDADNALLTIAKFLTTAIDAGAYSPEDDMVLIPFNKSCGTIELNKHIANHLARKRNAIVYEIIAGFQKSYLAVGDKVLFDKEDAIVTSIKSNPAYSGAIPQDGSITLDYWGCEQGAMHAKSEAESGDEDLDFLLSQSVSVGGEGEETVRQGSHIVTIQMQDTEREVTLSSAGDINSLLMSYALTVHKSQGSEWRKVFLILHQSHATMLQRELLYTAVTRAKEELYIICEPESFTSGIKSQRIKGNTLAEKAAYFMGKKLENGGTLL